MTQHWRSWAVGLALLVALPLAACKPDTAGEIDESGPAKVEHLEGAQPARITLTAEAAKRLDIQTEAVLDDAIAGKVHTTIPYSAVVYDTDGDTWTYTNPSPLVFVRYHIAVDEVVGDRAILASGPPRGAKVVTVGAAELFGSENEFEEE